MVTVHYFYDPMCGWCYGATALVEVLMQQKHLKLIMHPGGMIERRTMSASFRAMAHEHDAQIAQQTGQQFSSAYHARLQSSDSVILDSFLTAQMVELMERKAGQGFAMLKAIQRGHYIDGLDVSDPQTLMRLAKSLNDELDFPSLDGSLPDIKAVIEDSQQLMNQWKISGFPTFIIEEDNNQKILNHNDYFNNVSGWKTLVEQTRCNDKVSAS